MPIDSREIMRSVYDTLFSGYVNPPEGMVATKSADPDKVFLTMMWPGQQISERDVQNQRTPANPTGALGAAESFALLTDIAPALAPVFTAGPGKTLSQVYKMVVDAKVVPQEPDPAAVAAYSTADQLLHDEKTDVDASGKSIKVQMPSRAYLDYSKARAKYEDAVSELGRLFLSLDRTTPKGQEEWNALARPLQKAVKAASEEWEMAGRKKIEDAVATMAQSSQNQIGKLFQDAALNFASLGNPSAVAIDGGTWYPAYPSLGDWSSLEAAQQWSRATITSTHKVEHQHSDFQSIGGGAGVGFGLWSFGVDGSKDTKHEHMDSDSSNLEVGFSYTRIDISRPWLNGLLFQLPGWEIPGLDAGAISKGTKDQSDAMLPLIPVAFVAVRNLSISADWSKAERDLIESKLNAKASFGWGPFKISGSYSSGSKDENFRSDFDGRTIKNEGLQLIAWICTVTPASPPLKPTAL